MDNISSEFYEVSKIMQQIRNLVSAKLLSSMQLWEALLLESQLVKLYIPCILEKTEIFQDSNFCCQHRYMSRITVPNKMSAPRVIRIILHSLPIFTQVGQWIG
jgi:hypothetical protein